MRSWGYPVGLLACVMHGSPALAQTTSDSIIVRGEKREVPIQRTMASVSVLNMDEIETRGLIAIGDIFNRVANVSETFGTSGFSIRGISNVGVTGAGEAATASIYVDGVPLASTYLQAAPTQLWDVSQVEILRGPQSTLQGLNSLAGAIIIRTADPDLDRIEAQARLLGSDESKYNFSLAGGSPIVRNELAFRFSIEAQARDGFIRNVTRDASEDDETRVTLRAKVLWEPNAIPGFSARFGFTHYTRDGGFYNVFVRTDQADYFDHRISTDNTPNTTRLSFDSASMELQYELSDAVHLTNISSWSDALERSSYDLDHGPINAAYGAQRRDYRTLTEELRLNLEDDTISGLIGLYLYDRDLKSRTISRTIVPTPVSTIAMLLQGAGLDPQAASSVAATYGDALPVIPVDFDGSFPTSIGSKAIFADGRLRLNPHISVMAGFRYDHGTFRTRVTQQSLFVGTFPNPEEFGSLAPLIANINNVVGGFVSQATADLPEEFRTFDTFLPKVGVLVDWNNDISTSLVIQRGYRSGGSSINIARGENFAYKPEYTWNYEFALRSLWLGQRLRLNANAFYTDWQDQQVTVNFGLNAFDVHTVNAGRSHLYGIEIDSDFVVSNRLSLFASVGYIRTKFETFTIAQTGAVSDLSGTEFAFAPELTLVGGARFNLGNGINGAIEGKYSSRAFSRVGQDQTTTPVEPHTIINARIGYISNGWSIHVIGTNLLDENYVVYQSPGEARAVLNEPRTLALELRARF